MGPDPSFECDLETQLSWAPETTAKKMAPACVAPEPFVPPIWSEYCKLSQAMLSLLRLLVRQKGSSLNVPRPKTLMAAFGRPSHNTYRKFSLRSTCIS